MGGYYFQCLQFVMIESVRSLTWRSPCLPPPLRSNCTEKSIGIVKIFCYKNTYTFFHFFRLSSLSLLMLICKLILILALTLLSDLLEGLHLL